MTFKQVVFPNIVFLLDKDTRIVAVSLKVKGERSFGQGLLQGGNHSWPPTILLDEVAPCVMRESSERGS